MKLKYCYKVQNYEKSSVNDKIHMEKVLHIPPVLASHFK